MGDFRGVCANFAGSQKNVYIHNPGGRLWPFGKSPSVVVQSHAFLGNYRMITAEDEAETNNLFLRTRRPRLLFRKISG